MSKESEIAQLEKVIADSRTSTDEKEKFQKIVDKLKASLVPKEKKSNALVNSLLEDEDKIPEPKKTTSKKPDYDCDELIKEQKERAKKAKEAAEKRADAPKKSEVTKDKEKIEKVEENVKERIDSGKITKSELQKLIKETTDLLTMLKKALSKLK